MEQQEIISLIVDKGWEFDIAIRLINRIYEKQKNLSEENAQYATSLNVIHTMTMAQNDSTSKLVNKLSEIC